MSKELHELTYSGASLYKYRGLKKDISKFSIFFRPIFHLLQPPALEKTGRFIQKAADLFI
jgi:hypothetical protein